MFGHRDKLIYTQAHKHTHTRNTTNETFENRKREKQSEGARGGSGAMLPRLNIHFLSGKCLERERPGSH